ncbi:hypothetical protein FH972_025651 [Carpinus fangiana]|uniref:Major facilitator superfamily (MFS) profile domain-containing protein n=1 Tax=Carpinus fangiana TaxID=176857 RepID=A0A5N6L209_9ROSI|nr:hypothetical protein FH972_025651 [Carpinus fangiana]
MPDMNGLSPTQPTSGVLHNQHHDAAASFVTERAQPVDYEVERSAIRKIDRFFIPSMIIGYGLVYYDKSILGSAALFGMTTDLQLSVVVATNNIPPLISTSRLSWATAMFYFGMLAGLYPMTLATQRFRIGRVLGPLVIIWGMTTMLTAAVTTWRGLFAQRFFLGFVESVIPTAYMVIISGFYTQREQSLRQSLWFCSTGLFTITGGALNYGFAQITGGNLKRWQYIYLLAGALTIIFAVFCFYIPDTPMDAWFLTHEEKVAAVERLRAGQLGVRNHKIKWDQVREAALDLKFWLIAIMMASAYTVNGAVSGFGPLIVSTFGWSTLESILFQFPLGGVVLIFILMTGFLSSKFRNILIIQLVLCALPVLAGCIMIWKSTWSYHAAAPVVGYTLIGFFGPVVSLIITLGMANVAGATKKSLMAATIFVAYAVGNIIGPQLIRSQSKSRHYPQLWTGLIICYCILITSALLLYLHLWQENKRRKSFILDDEKMQESSFKDLTDRQNPYFQYVL